MDRPGRHDARTGTSANVECAISVHREIASVILCLNALATKVFDSATGDGCTNQFEPNAGECILDYYLGKILVLVYAGSVNLQFYPLRHKVPSLSWDIPFPSAETLLHFDQLLLGLHSFHVVPRKLPLTSIDAHPERMVVTTLLRLSGAGIQIFLRRSKRRP